MEGVIFVIDDVIEEGCVAPHCGKRATLDKVPKKFEGSVRPVAGTTT